MMHHCSWWRSTPHGKIDGTWQAGLWVVQLDRTHKDLRFPCSWSDKIIPWDGVRTVEPRFLIWEADKHRCGVDSLQLTRRLRQSTSRRSQAVSARARTPVKHLYLGLGIGTSSRSRRSCHPVVLVCKTCSVDSDAATGVAPDIPGSTSTPVGTSSINNPSAATSSSSTQSYRSSDFGSSPPWSSISAKLRLGGLASEDSTGVVISTAAMSTSRRPVCIRSAGDRRRRERYAWPIL